jgi:hypothetical protein
VNPPPSSRPALLLVLGFLLAPFAQAQTDLVALHPCAIVGVKDKQQLDELQALCATEMARGDVQLVPSEQVRAFLDGEPKGSCARAKTPATCLGKLATVTQASRAVLITITPGQLIRVSGLVVDATGEVADQKSIQIRNRGQPEGELVRTAITRLRAQLNVLPLKPAPLVEQPPPAPLVATPTPTLTPEPPPAPAQAEPPPAALEETRVARHQGPSLERTWKTPAAYASAGTGVAALGLAVFLAIDGNNAMLKSNEYYANNQLPIRSELEAIAELREQASTRRTLAGVSAAVGAALAGTGVYLWLTDRPASPPTPGAVSLSVGPGGLSLQGALP